MPVEVLMHIFDLPVNEDFQPYLVFEQFFSASECREILDQVQEFTPAGLGMDNQAMFDKRYRNCDESQIDYSETVDWLFRKLGNLVLDCNARHYYFEVTGFVQGLHVLRYKPESHFVWHSDHASGIGSARKLSVVVLLSAREQYQGGELCFHESISSEVDIVNSQGTVIIFPSFMVHRVTPVTRGMRYSLVGWVYGPPFR